MHVSEPKKEPKDMLIECLRDIRRDIINSLDMLAHNKTPLYDLNKAIGRIDNFLTILSYLNNTESEEE